MDKLLNISIGWFLYDFLSIALFSLLAFRINIKPKNRLILIVCITGMIIAIFGNGITMDYRAYWKIIQQVYYGSRKFIHLESIYIWLIHQIGPNYILWQCLIYIPSYIFFYFIVKKLNPRNLKLFLFCFVLFVMYHYCIGSRQFLFVSSYTLGLIFLWEKKYIKGIILLIICAFFHKMFIIGYPLALLLFIKIEKRLLLFIGLTFIAIILAHTFFKTLIEIINMVSGVGDNSSYTNNELVEKSSGSIWWSIIGQYSKFFLQGTLIFTLYKTHHILQSGTNIQKNIYSLTFWSILASYFFSNIGLVDHTIASRFNSLGYIGFCYLLSEMPNMIKIKNNYKLIFFIAMFGYFIMLNAFIKGVTNSTLLGDLPLE